MRRSRCALLQRRRQKRSRLHKPHWTRDSSLSARTAMVIFTGHSDPPRMPSLNARKVAFESAIKSGKNAEMDRSEWWTASDGRALEEVERAKRGLLFLEIK